MLGSTNNLESNKLAVSLGLGVNKQQTHLAIRAQKAKPSCYCEEEKEEVLESARRSTAITHLEAEMEVLYIDIFVGGGLALAPQQQALFGCHLLHRNVLDGESQDDGPDHAEGHLEVAVDDFLSADRHQLDALPFNELEGFVDVGDLYKKFSK